MMTMDHGLEVSCPFTWGCPWPSGLWTWDAINRNRKQLLCTSSNKACPDLWPP